MLILPVGGRLLQRQQRILCRICVADIIALIHHVTIAIRVLLMFLVHYILTMTMIIPMVVWLIVVTIMQRRRIVILPMLIQVISIC